METGESREQQRDAQRPPNRGMSRAQTVHRAPRHNSTGLLATPTHTHTTPLAVVWVMIFAQGINFKTLRVQK